MTDRLTLDEFTARLAALQPSGTAVGSDTALADLLGDKISTGVFRASLEQLLPGLPDDLLRTCSTVEELHRWYLARDPEVAEPTWPRVRLRPLADSDLPALYVASSSVESGFRWRYRGATPSQQEFLGQLFEGVLAQYVVEDRRTREAHGLVCAYGARLDAQTASIGLIRTSTTAGRGEVLEGFGQLVELCFRNWNLCKLYFEVPEFNAVELFDEALDLARIEGRLVDHHFFDGRWWDQLVVALWRDDWMADTRIRPLVTVGLT